MDTKTILNYSPVRMLKSIDHLEDQLFNVLA